ncbi:hypothetical protein R3P38DRAFT_2948531 [Favolaschia claudopus]|uniref:Uncharacterized protein n=1 Tax=Favolaschia claudopus TaxID=2862362 RepID=A0AAW0BK38_9AGAR
MSRRWENPSPVRQHSSTGSDNSDPFNEDPGLSSPSCQPSGDGLPLANPRKRREAPDLDLIQYAQHIARKCRLKPGSTKELIEYSQLDAPQQSIWLAGQSLQMNEKLDGIQPPETPYNMSATLEGFIDKYSFLLLIDPKTSAYVAKGKDGPVERLKAYLRKTPDSGLTLTIAQDKAKVKVIESRMRAKLTHGRNAIKDVIAASLGHDDQEPVHIVNLCQQVLDLSYNKEPDVNVSVEMCGRFAFLRESYTLQLKNLAANPKPNVAMDYWGGVDKDLKSMREAKGNDPGRISLCIADTLADDRRLYGSVDLGTLVHVSPISVA